MASIIQFEIILTEDSYQIYGLLRSFTDLNLAVNYFSENLTRNDLNISFLQDQQNYLKFKSFFRPNFIEDLWQRLRESQVEVDESNNERKVRMKIWLEEVGVEMAEKKDHMAHVMTPYHTALEGFVERIGLIGERWRAEVERLYEFNSLFIADLDGAVKAFLQKLKLVFKEINYVICCLIYNSDNIF